MRIKFDLEPVANWRKWHKMASLRLAAVASALIGFIITNPTFLFSPVMFLPDEWKLVSAMAVAIFVFALVAATRLLKKKDHADGLDAAPEPGQSDECC